MGCCRARTLALLTLVTVHAAAQHTTSSGERLGSGSSTNASHAQLADWHPHGYIPGLKVRGTLNQRAQTPASRLSSPQSALAKAYLPSEPTHLTTTDVVRRSLTRCTLISLNLSTTQAPTSSFF